MNIINQRAALKNICDQLWPKQNLHLAPLFVWRERKNAKALLDKQGWESPLVQELIYTPAYRRAPEVFAGPIFRLPYGAFLLHVVKEADHGDQTFLVVNNPASNFPDLLMLFESDGLAAGSVYSLTGEPSKKPSGERGYVLRCYDAKSGALLLGDRAVRLIEALYRAVAVRLPGEVSSPADSRWISGFQALLSLTLIQPFLFEVFHPGNYVVRARPENSSGRSVEWVKAREHFLVMDRKSMAGAQPSAGGRLPVLNAGDDSRILKRAAHARIAHFRLLKSTRYGVNVGKRVWVKPHWVGPTEWIGTDQKIYTLLSKKPGAPE